MVNQLSQVAVARLIVTWTVTAAMWLATFAASLGASVFPPAFMAAGILLGVGYVIAGVSLFRFNYGRVTPQQGSTNRSESLTGRAVEQYRAGAI